ncbi:MAG: DNA polymerase III subunit gamma/tau [Bacteroidetes bacterium]|nr:MAG: DNA polymerase III subunit gamma/tau [Bacteroidota bacterium]
MDKFIVSARKYRPQTFSSVVGQPHITTTLKNAIKNNQLAHAFLFCGPRGVGKTTCARILAKTINCENRTPDGEACNKCTSCISFNEGSSLNIHELDAASNNSVDDIRTLVEQVRFAPQAGKYKVYIIDEVHMLSSSAFNAFLKTLEEPPHYAIFILATTEKHKILPTILSRCQIFDFKRITVNDTVGHLQEICEKETIKADKESLELIAQKSEGCMRDALSILDKIVSFTNGQVKYEDTLEHLNILDADYYFKLMDCMLNQKLADAMLLYDGINRKGFEGDQVLNGFAEFIRNLLVSKDEKAASLLEVVESFREKYIATAQKTDVAYLISALNILSDAELNYKAARNKRLHVELTLIKLCYLQQAIEIVSNGDGAGKKKLTETVKPVAFRNIQPIEVRKHAETPAGKPVKKIEKEDAALILESAPATAKSPDTGRTNSGLGKTDVESKTPATGPGFDALSKIRQQFLNRPQNDGENSSKPLEQTALEEAWQQYTRQLKLNKNSATQSFQRAQLRILDQNNFEITTNNNLEQKFIEQEKRNLSDFLQQFFNNKILNFSIVIAVNPITETAEEKMLSKKEQYLQMVEKYPLVKELKDRLKLELDY